MKKIGLLSDTHSYFDGQLYDFFQECDEIWHAGDVGDPILLETMENFKPFKLVYGNIDGREIRLSSKKDLWFDCEGMLVYMTHIGGYPGRYSKRMREIFNERTPDLFICGHSHILKVMYDQKYDFLHVNPGAVGHTGFHKIRTAVRFSIEDGKIGDFEVIELGPRGQKS